MSVSDVESVLFDDYNVTKLAHENQNTTNHK